MLSLILAMTVLAIPVNTNAEENNNYQDEKRVITLYLDLDDNEKVTRSVNDTFDKYGDGIIIEVVDIGTQVMKKAPIIKVAPRVVTNRKRFFITRYSSTIGTISCTVLGDAAYDCTGSVEIYGEGITFAYKNLYNTTNTSAYMAWALDIDGYRFSYTVKLFD